VAEETTLSHPNYFMAPALLWNGPRVGLVLLITASSQVEVGWRSGEVIIILSKVSTTLTHQT